MIQAAGRTARANVSLLEDRYRDAGVDTDEANAGLKKLSSHITKTWPTNGQFGVKLDIGYFANVIDVGGGQGIAITTDGVGSKTMIADKLKRYKTIGIDCVAMNVNDLICVGARPISMVDYLAIKKVDENFMDELGIGLSEGARLAGISICGGETAQLRDMIEGFDLAGTAIGHVSLDKILVGQNIELGDVVLGVASNGIHSNGLSLARQAFLENGRYDLSHKFPELDGSLGDELLRPTHIYVKEALELLSRVKSVKALIHITSDGLLNLLRVKTKAEYVIDNLPPTPPVFSLIQKLENVSDARMFEVFNMGIGLCAVIGKADAELGLSVLRSEGKDAFRIGHVTSTEKRRVLIPDLDLAGEDKHFYVQRAQ
jgi:phosphoribosylformylglycinamidine cyclo-ligase